MFEEDVYGGLEEDGEDNELGDWDAGYCSGRHCARRAWGDGDVRRNCGESCVRDTQQGELGDGRPKGKCLYGWYELIVLAGLRDSRVTVQLYILLRCSRWEGLGA